MTITQDQLKQLGEAAKPLLEFLAENCHPHCSVIVTGQRVELVEGLASIPTRHILK